MIFSTHRELFRLRPNWRDSDGTTPECDGRMVVDPETEQAPSGERPIWIAICDRCGLTVGVPPRQQQRWLGESAAPPPTAGAAPAR